MAPLDSNGQTAEESLSAVTDSVEEFCTEFFHGIKTSPFQISNKNAKHRSILQRPGFTPAIDGPQRSAKPCHNSFRIIILRPNANSPTSASSQRRASPCRENAIDMPKCAARRILRPMACARCLPGLRPASETRGTISSTTQDSPRWFEREPDPD